MTAGSDPSNGKPTKPVRVRSPSRLHFGLLRFRAEHSGERSFGGLGMMIGEPRVAVEVELAEQWTAEGLHADRALRFAKLTAKAIGDETPLAVRVLEAPLEHVGLGLGTQLALCTSAAVHQTNGRADPAADALAQITGRGNRSAVGAYGFERGGLILENGFIDGNALGEFIERAEFPKPWQILLATLPTNQAIHGLAEQRAFDDVPRVAEATTARLWELATEQILPAAKSHEFEQFSEGVFEYNRRAGECFAAVQGGAYASERIAEAIDRLRVLGMSGVGQSSWGPTVFALTESQEMADDLKEKVVRLPEFDDACIRITEADNCGRRLNCG